MLVDTHCHVHDREFFSAEQATKMLERAYENDVKRVICVGTDPKDSAAAHDFAAQSVGAPQAVADAVTVCVTPQIPHLYWTFGIHPEKAKDQATVKNLTADLSFKKHDLPIAIGEVGLDYHYEGYNQFAQIRLLEIMLQLASDLDLPLSFHVREAFDDFLPVVANFPGVTGVIHSFSDNKKHLRQILNTTEFYIGVNGLATYSTLPMPPLERIVLETDAPFLTPVPFRGIINEPGYVSEVAKWLAHQLGQDYQTIAKETTKNAKKLFRF